MPSLLAAACHLADEPEVRCPPGQYADMGRCKAEDPVGPTIVLGASCSVTPATLTTKANETFRFRNDDKVDHAVRGQDGQTWAVVKAGTSSDYIGLTKVGSWPFDVDACAKAGTVVVE